MERERGCHRCVVCGALAVRGSSTIALQLNFLLLNPVLFLKLLAETDFLLPDRNETCFLQRLGRVGMGMVSGVVLIGIALVGVVLVGMALVLAVMVSVHAG